jgi:hypothetical protein
MKITIKTEDQKEAMRHVKALDMALALFDIHQLMYRDDAELDTVNGILAKYNIILDDLIE